MCNNMFTQLLVKLGLGSVLIGAIIFLLSSLWFTFYAGKVVGLLTCCMGSILIIAGCITHAIAQDNEDTNTELPEVVTSNVETRRVPQPPKPNHTWISQALLTRNETQSSSIPLVPACVSNHSYTYGWASAQSSNSYLDQPPPSYDEAVRESYRRTF